MERRDGAYVGLVAGAGWLEKLLSMGSVRGAGEYWYDDIGFYFKRFFIKEPIFIPRGSVWKVDTSTSHAGRWLLGVLLIRIHWKKDGVPMASGFQVSTSKEKTLAIKEELERYFFGNVTG